MLTENEVKMLKFICESDFHNGTHPVKNHVWYDSPWSNKVASGVCSSLSKKDYAAFYDKGRDATMYITQEGFDALKEVDPEFCNKF